MQVLSHGDRIAEGRYRLHSRFRRAANFLGDAGLVTVVDPSIGAGPINIAIDRLDSDLCFPTLTVKTDCFVLGQTALKKNPGCLYRSVIRLQPRDSRTFLENLAVLGDCLRGDAPSGSMAFLLGRNGSVSLSSAYERELFARMRDGLCLLKEHRLAEGARVFRGAGCGLTPGGDDFLSGFLLGLNVAERICGDNLEDARIEIYRNSVGENAISNATLACSRDGRLTERFRDLVFSMVHCSGAEVRGNAGRLFEMGATSGADAAAGFYVATVLYLRPLNHVGPGFSPDSEHLGRHSGLTPSHITAEEPSGLQPGPTRYFETL